MSENYAGKSRHPPVTLTCLLNKAQRSRSIDNTLQQEPKLQPVRILERQVSLTEDSKWKRED